MYLTKDDVVKAIKQMKSFETDLASVFSDRGYNFRKNLGRRNALLSVSQEREVARVLRQKFNTVVEDGSPGNPDIYIEDIDTELECKLTSGSKSKNSVSYALQTDWDTLCKKKKLDYLYFITDQDFDKFCVLFFQGLTPDDFFPPAPGSRGKSRMNKTKAMKKATCLVGDFLVHNEKYINDITSLNMKEFEDHVIKMRQYWKEYAALGDNVTKKNKVLLLKQAETQRHQKVVAKLTKRLKYWKESPKRYKLILSAV